MLEKIKAAFAYVHAPVTVGRIDLLMLALCLVEFGLRQTVETIQAVQAGGHGIAYYHGAMAVGAFGWALECAVVLKGNSNAST